jgi:hypothetical protein
MRKYILLALTCSLLVILVACDNNPTGPSCISRCGSNIVTYRAESFGANANSSLGRATFYKDGVRIYSETGGAGRGRGFNIAAINPENGELIGSIENFDTYITRRNGSEMYRMISFLNGITHGTILIFAAGDEIGLTFDRPSCLPNPTRDSICCRMRDSDHVRRGIETLEVLGSREIRSYCYRNSWAMIAIKGDGVAHSEMLVEGRSQGASVEISFEVR